MDFVDPTTAAFCKWCGQAKNPTAVAWAGGFFGFASYEVGIGHFRCALEAAQQAHDLAGRADGAAPEMIGRGYWRDTLGIAAAAIEPTAGLAPWSYPSAANLAAGLPQPA